MNKSTNKPCAKCGKILVGKVDKRFCDAYCRNAHNNQNKVEDAPHSRDQSQNTSQSSDTKNAVPTGEDNPFYFIKRP